MLNDKLEAIIAKTSDETGFEKSKVRKIVENAFAYLRHSMSNLEYKRYYIPKFGNFDIIPKRYMKYLEKHNMINVDTVENETTKSKKRNTKAKDYVKANKTNEKLTN